MLKQLLASSLLAGSVLAVGATPALAQSAPAVRADDHWDHDWRGHGRHDHGHDWPFLRRVTAATPLIQQPTCRTPGKIAAPGVRGVTYTLKSHWRPMTMTPGTWYAKAPGHYQVEAAAEHGYALQGQRTWSIDLRTPRWCHQR